MITYTDFDKFVKPNVGYTVPSTVFLWQHFADLVQVQDARVEYVGDRSDRSKFRAEMEHPRLESVHLWAVRDGYVVAEIRIVRADGENWLRYSNHKYFTTGVDRTDLVDAVNEMLRRLQGV